MTLNRERLVLFSLLQLYDESRATSRGFTVVNIFFQIMAEEEQRKIDRDNVIKALKWNLGVHLLGESNIYFLYLVYFIQLFVFNDGI